ncbi:hypothetical protein U3516DRAFT_837763 [Neocallimastix sp. 'constans']
MKRHCIKGIVNTGQCELPNSGIKEGDIIYLFEDGDINPKFLASKVNLNIKSTLIEENNDEIESTKYQYFNTDKTMYLLNSNNQSFDPVKESGNYIFKKTSYYYNLIPYYHNLIPYKSTVNTTDTTRIQIYSYVGNWSVKKEFKFENFDEGYYWNKADLNGEGIVIQVMNVPPKKEVEEENKLRKRDEDENKGVCSSAQEGKKLGKGDACIVVDGEFRGLYLAIDNITKNSSNSNCIRYDKGNCVTTSTISKPLAMTTTTTTKTTSTKTTGATTTTGSGSSLRSMQSYTLLYYLYLCYFYSIDRQGII